jgi:hypothetical protein
MKKVIIGIHGLGNKPPKELEAKWWKDSILEGFRTSGVKKSIPEFELVYWADIVYDKPLDQWEKNKEDPYFLDEPYVEAPKVVLPEDTTLRPKIVEFISSQLKKIFLNEDNSLNYTFVTDKIIKKYFRDLDLYHAEENKMVGGTRVLIRELIRKRLADTLKKYENYEILVVAHSMGSIIAFDVLKFSDPVININTLVTIGSPLGLPIVISKIAAEQKKNNDLSKEISSPSGISRNWYNLSDVMDYVAIDFELFDDFSANEYGVVPTDILVHNTYEFNEEKNPHKSYGYLRTPEFAEILNNFIGIEEQNAGQRIVSRIKNFVTNFQSKFMSS